MRPLATFRPLLALLLCLGAVFGHAGERTVLTGVVVGVIDGDTADVRLDSGMIRVRFHAIDAPESGQPHGKAAKAALADLVYGKTVAGRALRAGPVRPSRRENLARASST